MTLREITYLIADRLAGTTAPSHIVREEIAASIGYWRAMLLRREYSSNGTFPLSARQYLGMVPLELVDAATNLPVGNDDVDAVNLIRRTTLPIPQPVRVKSSGDFVYVGGYGFQNPYAQVTPHEALVRLSNKYTSDTPCFAYHNSYINVYNSNVKTIAIQAVFERPAEAATFNQFPGADLYDDDNEYPLPLDLVQNIVAGILSGEYAMTRRQTDPSETAIQPQA